MKAIIIILSLLFTSCIVSTDCEECYKVLYFQNKMQDTLETGYFCGEERNYNNYNGYVNSCEVDSSGNIEYNEGQITIKWICPN